MAQFVHNLNKLSLRHFLFPIVITTKKMQAINTSLTTTTAASSSSDMPVQIAVEALSNCQREELQFIANKYPKSLAAVKAACTAYIRDNRRVLERHRTPHKYFGWGNWDELLREKPDYFTSPADYILLYRYHSEEDIGDLTDYTTNIYITGIKRDMLYFPFSSNPWLLRPDGHLEVFRLAKK